MWERILLQNSIYLAWQYLRYHRLTAAVLITAITSIVFLPAALQVISNNAESHLRKRTQSNSLLVGPKGSELELVLGSVYYDKPLDDVLQLAEVHRLEEQEMGQVIPLHTRFEARDCLLVGTNKEYFGFRNLNLAKGGMWSILGECVVGARVAKRLGIQIGSRIPVDSTSAFLLQDAPIRLRVVGILSLSETPDDDVIFTNLETTWIVEGLGHGHTKSAKHGSPEAKLYTDIHERKRAKFSLSRCSQHISSYEYSRRANGRKKTDTADGPVFSTGRNSTDVAPP